MDQIAKKLIALVRSYPFLYDRSDAMYNNAAQKDKTWKLIASAMNIALTVTKRKWKTLRDKYSQYLKQRSDPEMPCYRKLELKEKWKPMQFLERHVKPKKGLPRESRQGEAESPRGAQQKSNPDPDAIELLFSNFAMFVRSINCPVLQAKVKLQLMQIITDATITIDPNGLKDPARFF